MQRYLSFLLIVILSFLPMTITVHAATPAISGFSDGTFANNYIFSSALAPLDSAKISFQEIATGLTRPVLITHAGDGSGRIFFVEQPGRIRIQKIGTLLATPFLDIQSIIKTTGNEQGLLALAFDPAYVTNGNF